MKMTLGDSFGQLIYNTTIEKAIFDNNPTGAIQFLVDSFPGMTEEYAISVICGDYVIKLNDDKTGIFLTDNIEDSDYKLRDIHELLRCRKNRTLEDIDDILETANGVFTEYKFNRSVKCYIWDVFKMLAGNFDDLSDELIICKNIYTNFNTFVESVNQTNDMFKWFIKYAPNVFKNDASYFDLSDRINEVIDIVKSLQDLKKYSCDYSEMQISGTDIVDRFMNTMHNLDKMSNEGIKPVDTDTCYNAYWISPDGTLFGCDGEVAALLHLQMADMLYNAGYITNKEDNETPESWLDRNGWAKMHNNEVHFAKYISNDPGDLTPEQINVICEIGDKYYNGNLSLGTFHKHCRTMKLKSTEKPMLFRLFNNM